MDSELSKRIFFILILIVVLGGCYQGVSYAFSHEETTNNYRVNAEQVSPPVASDNVTQYNELSPVKQELVFAAIHSSTEEDNLVTVTTNNRLEHHNPPILYLVEVEGVQYLVSVDLSKSYTFPTGTGLFALVTSFCIGIFALALLGKQILELK